LDGKADWSWGSGLGLELLRLELLGLELLGLEELLRLRSSGRGGLGSSSLGSRNDSESIGVQRGVEWIRSRPWAGGRLTSLVEGLEHKEGVLSGLGPSRSWLGCSRGRSRHTHSSWLCWARWQAEGGGSRSLGRGKWSRSRYVQGLKVKLEGSSRYNTSIAGLSRSGSRSRCANGRCGRSNSGSQGKVIVSNGSWGRCSGGGNSKRSSSVLQVDTLTAGNVLLQLSLEGSSLLVEHKLALEGGGWLFSIVAVLLKGQGRSIQGEALKLRVKVERSSRNSLGDGRSSRLNPLGNGRGGLGRNTLISNVQQVCQGIASISVRDWSPLGDLATVRVGVGSIEISKVGEGRGLLLDGGGSWLFRGLGSFNGGPSVDLGSDTLTLGGLRDLILGQLNILGLTESFTRINRVFAINLIVVINVLQLLSILSNVTGQTRSVGVLSLDTVRINVTILAACDTVNTTCLLPEGAISTDISEGEATIIILVRVSLQSSYSLLLFASTGTATGS